MPNIRHMETRHQQRVSKDRWLGREKRHYVLIPVDLAGVRVVSVYDVAEWAVRIACKHLRPTILGLT